jgi:hypothetical protein
MNPNAMLAGAITIAFVTAAAGDAASRDGSRDGRAGALHTDFSKPQVKCYREMTAGKASCKGKDNRGDVFDRTTNEHTSVGRYFTTDAVTCHEAGLTTTPPRG